MRSIRDTTLLLLVVASTAMAQVRPEGDEWLRRPVDERTFRTYLSFFAYDKGVPLDARVATTQDMDGVRLEHLTYQSTPGLQVPARLYHAQGGGKRPGVVLIHGGGPQGKDSPGLMAIAQFLARAGYTTLSFDLQ